MKPMSAMNVIPFIDVMLVLLAIVLTTATFVAQGKIPVNLPQAAQAEPLKHEPQVEITILASGAIHVGEREIDAEALAGVLAGLDRQDAVLLRVDEAAAFRHFVAVIDMAKSRQLQNLSIVTRRAGQ